jgi:hypothetical protein
MSTNLTPASFVDRLSEIPFLDPANFTRFSSHYERWMKGMMNVTLHQLEATQDWVRGSLEDFDLLTEARSPGALVQAELEIFRRRSRGASGAARKIADELRRTFVESSALVVEPAGAKEGPSAAVAAVTPEAADVQQPAIEVKADAATSRKSTALSSQPKVTVAEPT